MTPPLIGTRAGNYTIVGLLGEGGMGAVYEAQHEHMGWRRAVKVLHPSFAQNPALVQRLFNEARAVNAINQSIGKRNALSC